MAHEIEVFQPSALTLAPHTSRAAMMRQHIAEQIEMRAILAEYVHSQMVLDVDYGIIPGTKNKTLLKPGAEKICGLYEVTPDFTTPHRTENWESGLFHYEIKCTLTRDGVVQAVGMGSANSYEGKHRWRNGERLCPDCNKATIIKGKPEYGGGWICFAKKGGCGAKFTTDAAEIIEQEIGRVQNDDMASLVNTVLKMSKKRALVDGAIALVRGCALFTQDHGDPENDNSRRPAAGRDDARSTAAQAVGRDERPRRTAEPPPPPPDPGSNLAQLEPTHGELRAVYAWKFSKGPDGGKSLGLASDASLVDVIASDIQGRAMDLIRAAAQDELGKRLAIEVEQPVSEPPSDPEATPRTRSGLEAARAAEMRFRQPTDDGEGSI